MIKGLSILLFATILILSQSDPSPWTQSSQTTACKALPGETIFAQSRPISILNSQNILLTSSVNSFMGTNDNSYKTKFQVLWKYYIQKGTLQGSQVTYLGISSAQISNGQGINFSPVQISNQYQFIAADGPLVLLINTKDGDADFISLYTVNIGGAGLITQSDLSSTFTGLEFKKMWYLYDSISSEVNLLGIVQTLNPTTGQVGGWHMRTGQGDYLILSKPLYTFTASNANSQFYLNYRFALEINGNVVKGYRYTPASQQIYLQDSSTFEALNLNVNPYSQSKVINLVKFQKVAMWSNNFRNIVTFKVRIDDSYNLHAQDKNQYSSDSDNAMRLFSDERSYFLVIDSPNTQFFLTMTNQIDSQITYDYYNAGYDDGIGNAQIMNDFSSVVMLKIFFSGGYLDDASSQYFQNRFFYLYYSDKMIKYLMSASNMPVQGTDNWSFTFNKEYQVNIDTKIQNMFAEKGASFEIGISLKCVCSTTGVTEFVCFFQTQECIFTVQNINQYCTPPPQG